MIYIFMVQSYKVFNFPPITILGYSLYLNCGIFVRLCVAKITKCLLTSKMMYQKVILLLPKVIECKINNQFCAGLKQLFSLNGSFLS